MLKVVTCALILMAGVHAHAEYHPESLGQVQLAQQTSTSSSSSSGFFNSLGGSKSDKNDFGIASFCFGLLLIPLSLVCIWQNERKIVVYHKLMQKALKELKGDIKADDPVDDKDEYELVHVKGRTFNEEVLKLDGLDYSHADCYRVKSTVEMYQWHETSRQEGSDDNKRTVYEHHKAWASHKINSGSFHHSAGHENPTKDWPFESESVDATKITFGKYVLSKESATSLGHYKTEEFNDEEKGQLNKVLEHTQPKMVKHSFQELKRVGNYLYSSADPHAQLGSDHIGSFRVQIEYAPCDMANVMGQLIQDTKNSEWTFRKWNPEKEKVPFGEDTSQKTETADCYCCYICQCVNCCFDLVAEEVVWDHWDGASVDQEAKSKIKGHDEVVKKMGYCIRPLSILACMFGFYLLFAPIVQLLSFIPLVGWLLSAIVALAAAITAFFVGGTIACLTMAIAWIFWRPCIGITLLLVVGLGIAAIFVVPLWLKDDDGAKSDI